MEGLTLALRTYTRKTDSLAIYVIGDDFTDSSYDAALRKVAQLNTNSITGKPIARIHGVGILNRDFTTTNHRFATLMREMARQNGGAFIALAE